MSSKILLIIFSTLGVLITFWARDIVFVLFGDGYRESVVLLQVIIWSFVLTGIRFLFENFMIISHAQGLYLKLVAIFVSCNFILNIVLIPTYGAMGAAIATVSADLCFLLLIFRILPNDFFHGYFSLFVTASVLVMATLVVLKLSEYSVGVLSAFLFGIIMMVLHFYRGQKDSIRTILRLVKHV